MRPDDSMFADSERSIVYWAGILILAIVTFRLISLGLYPLYDTTEARYGEMARLMLETQNWITPQYDYGVPFWGKPPFHTWISAASFSLFGVSEFVARLPHFVCGVVSLFMVYGFARTFLGRSTATFAALVFASCIGTIVAIGMVMTDSALLMACTLAMVSFWLSYSGRNRSLFGHLFFVAISLGMLIKGPVAVVIIGIALVFWSVWQGVLLNAIRSLPWSTGLPLCLVLTLPWYIWAEIRTPGFLEYFIVGEHIQRFLVSGWEGDLYGSAHDKPRGMIWLFWLVCAFPWSFWILKSGFRRLFGGKPLKSKAEQGASQTASLNRYLIAWMVAPLLLFTLAGNILPTYVLPGFSAMALLVATNNPLTRSSLYMALLSLFVLAILVGVVGLGKLNKPNESVLLRSEMQAIGTADLYYWGHRPYSAQFYSDGNAKLLDDDEHFASLLQQRIPFFLVIDHRKYRKFEAEIDSVCRSTRVLDDRALYVCHP
ncbi:hypothetical protein Mag101_08290 [Microbulbifer agarilyticus]|uniref:ArnT-like N-terminal domain-containing protein n=1 Tax=Microbulbifer agarilyticus TaxID=260552 RepID=A0A1Q2M5S7_9GAMM|nr:glycosyltransferase family 39 protein [Microbulbifer agarilyticus]AQQ67637.1 hypothetical protein Mag101_08290 [Microbulbifer agarilyticus]